MEYRGWICNPTKQSDEYIRGVNTFLEFAFQTPEDDGKILCPCTKCANYKSHSRSTVYEHLTDPRYGFLRRYTEWIFHGERSTTSSCISKIHKPKKLKASLSEKQELLDELKQMRESQERTCALLANFATLIQNRFSVEDVNDIIQPATQVSDASSVLGPTSFPSPDVNEDGREEDK
ncbi:uncharacterized protein [Medicago truncatula]|uniref:uncharacterized protein n=1 Tax=Medicago truncatula TaxID=3880 RepID=UPI000D2F37F7|nr:uncharacterized protein LOC112419035 [Medicago truncatula]